MSSSGMTRGGKKFANHDRQYLEYSACLRIPELETEPQSHDAISNNLESGSLKAVNEHLAAADETR